jgi:lipase chaperone LimK
MIACESMDEAVAIQKALGGLMHTLVQRMPQLGWRLVADALAHIQIRCLADGAAALGLAQESNAQFFQSLRQSLPRDQADAIFAHANRAAIAWQQAQRTSAPTQPLESAA